MAKSKPNPIVFTSEIDEVDDKRGPGRPSKYDDDMHPTLIVGYAEEGLVCAEIADKFSIGASTLSGWLKAHPELFEAYKEGVARSLGPIVRSLYERARGYEYDEIKVEGKANSEGGISGKRITKTTKRVHPDVAAIMCVLTNKDPENWKHRSEMTLRQAPSFAELEDLSDEELYDIIHGNGNQEAIEINLAETSESKIGDGKEAPA